MVSDAHFITPTDGKVNGQRSNYPHGTVGSATWTSLNGSKSRPEFSSWIFSYHFEPIDIQRRHCQNVFYLSLDMRTPFLDTYPMFNGSSNGVLQPFFEYAFRLEQSRSCKWEIERNMEFILSK
jgi:hypothetical protein